MNTQRAMSGITQLPIPRLLAATNNFAFVTILGIVLVNAAGVIATVTYMGSIWGTQVAADLTAPSARCLEFFCLGMLAAMVASSSGYIAQMFYELGGRRARASLSRGVSAGLAIYFHCMALAAVALGVVTFAWGTWSAFTALSS